MEGEGAKVGTPAIGGFPATEPRPSAASPGWSLAKRVGFRFVAVYFPLYILATQILPDILVPDVDVPEPGTLGPARALVEWVAHHVFGVSTELVVTGSGSGDKIFDWTLVFCLLVLASLGTAVWSLLDRRRGSYAALDRWLRVLVRTALGSTLVVYGMDKVVPLQMPYPDLRRLVEPYGSLSPMEILWASIGASPAYEIFTGCAEALGGILVLFPRTALLGALVCLADTVEVFVLDLTYDVPVKLFSLHLILFCLFLLAPEWARLRDFFLGGSAVGPPTQRPLFRSRRANRVFAATMALYVVYLLGMALRSDVEAWSQYGGGAPRSPLYGIWSVEEWTMDGVSHPGLVGDAQRWRRLIFQYPPVATAQRMDDYFVRFRAKIGAQNRRLGLTQADDEKWTAGFLVERPAPDRLVLQGDMDHHRARLELRLEDQAKFLLPNRGFHWVQERPVNR